MFQTALYHVASFLQAGPVGAYRSALTESERWHSEELEKHQTQLLRRLVATAKRDVPYYRHALRALHSEDIRCPQDVKLLPVLDKSALQRLGPDLRSERRGTLVRKTTGGSTGEPVTVFKTRDAWARELAATWRGYKWANVEIGDRQARFWGVPLGWRGRARARITDWACNRRRYSAFDIDVTTLLRYVERLEQDRPVYLYGYVSSLVEFAVFLDERHIALAAPPQCVITTAEVLRPTDREIIQKAFRARVFNEYGCGELGTIAHECEAGRLHLSAENMIVEIEKGRDADGIGEIVVTELNNHAMPLIRYRTGDRGALSNGPCECGRTLPILTSICGREYDAIVNRDGRRFHAEVVMYLFEEEASKSAGIRQFQVEQIASDHFIVRIVAGSEWTHEMASRLKQRIRSEIEPTALVSVDVVESLPRERSGKVRVVKGLPADSENAR